MKEYFLPQATEAQQQRLREQEVPFEISIIDETLGIRIPSDHLYRACRVLDLSFRKVLPPRCEDTGWVKCWSKGKDEPLPTARTGTYKFELPAEPFLEILEETLVPFFGMDVRLTHPKWMAKPLDGGELGVHIYTRPVAKTSLSYVPGTIWGIGVGSHHGACVPNYSYAGAIDLVDEETGYCVARLIGHNLYIRYLNRYQRENSLEIFRKTCEVLIQRLREYGDEVARQAFYESKFVALCARQNPVEEAREDLEQCDVAIRKRMTQIEQHSRSLRDLEQEWDYLINGPDESEMILEELAQIHEHPSVIGIRVLEAELHVYTDTLFCIHEGTKVVYEIGRFLIILPLNGWAEADSIRWVNLSRMVGDHYAPHVPAFKEACLGEAKLNLNLALKERNYLQVVVLAIVFCESATIGDHYGNTLVNYPLAETISES